MAELKNKGIVDDDEDSSPSSILRSSVTEDSDSTSESDDSINPCVKLGLPENIAAYYDKRELIRDTEPVSCDDGLVEKVMGNYIIAKKILSNLCWQDRLLCKHVCVTWRSAINALSKEQAAPVDFVYIYELQRNSKGVAKFKKSENFCNEPLAVLIFTNSDGFHLSSDCRDMSPCPCTPPCKKKTHCLLDAIHRQAAAPKNCMLTVIATYLTYMPLPQSICSAHTIQRYESSVAAMAKPFIGGIYIPVIPGAEFHVLNIKQKNRNTIDVQTDFYDVIDKLAQDRIIKGVLVYVTEKYILDSAENIVFLNYLNEVQPDIPYALGGCIVEETMFQQTDINFMIERFNTYTEFVSENLISIGVFTVPKNVDTSTEKCNFEMYSLVIESSEWEKTKIQQAINEFAKKVPVFEQTVALKLSCVGRDQKHALEQDYFRAAFPHTPLIGCYGNGELGVNHPPRPPPADPPRNVKRHRRNPRQQGIMYSYSTVFVYIGWGKITSAEDS